MKRFRFVRMFFVTVGFAAAVTAFFFLLAWMDSKSIQESFAIYRDDLFPFLRVWFLFTYVFLVVFSFAIHPLAEQAKSELENLERGDA